MEPIRKLCRCCGHPYFLCIPQGNWTDHVCVSCEAESLEADGVTLAIVGRDIMREVWQEEHGASIAERQAAFYRHIEETQRGDDDEWE